MLYGPFHHVGDEAGLHVCACTFPRLLGALWAMTTVADLEWRGVLRLRQTSQSDPMKPSVTVFIPFRIEPQGGQGRRQKTASSERKKPQVQRHPRVLKGLKGAGVLRASDAGGTAKRGWESVWRQPVERWC